MLFDILGKSLHYQMILGPPDGSLDFFLNTRGFWLNGLRRNSILKNDPPKNDIFRETGEISILRKWLFLFYAPCGPGPVGILKERAQRKGARERKGPKEGDQRKGAIFIDGRSMNSLMDVHQ
jgi:hypothetical protein